ncbi:MAG: hypothetical protein HFI86_05690 [Bacilli bacterium]|nr:hypothetical protein [Bacilli bacterium]
MNEDIKSLCGNITLKLDNTAEYEDWLTIQDYIDELIADKEHLKEEIKSLKQNIEDNYRPIPISEQVGISDRDFI